jgi:hypothetical protein
MCDRNSCVCGTNDPEPTVESFVLEVASSVPLPLVFCRVVEFISPFFNILNHIGTTVIVATS